MSVQPPQVSQRSARESNKVPSNDPCLGIQLSKGKQEQIENNRNGRLIRSLICVEGKQRRKSVRGEGHQRLSAVGPMMEQLGVFTPRAAWFDPQSFSSHSYLAESASDVKFNDLRSHAGTLSGRSFPFGTESARLRAKTRGCK